MLVLTRKTDESIVIGGGGSFEHLLKVTVLGVRKGAVRLGFEVDVSIPIHRWEVWQRTHGTTGADVSDDVLG
jgi:carbon storage regulator CsrA